MPTTQQKLLTPTKEQQQCQQQQQDFTSYGSTSHNRPHHTHRSNDKHELALSPIDPELCHVTASMMRHYYDNQGGGGSGGGTPPPVAASPSTSNAIVATTPMPTRQCPLCLRPFLASASAQDYPSRTYFQQLQSNVEKRVADSSSDNDGIDDNDVKEARLRDDSNSNVDDAEAESAARQASGYYNQNFQEIRKLGQGTFAAVYVCQHMLEDVPLGVFAVKKIPIGTDQEYLARVLKEVCVFERVHQHANVLEYYHCWVDHARTADFGPTVRCLFILMEYATEGSLDDYLERHGRRISNSAVWYFFLGALEGVAHLHSCGVLHRDLKPQNLLLTKSHIPGAPPRLVVGDFGTAGDIEGVEASKGQRTGGTGTMEYMAPELFEVSVETGEYVNQATEASDVFSLGMVLHYLMCEGRLPTVTARGELVFDRKRLSQRPREMVELMVSMLSRSAAARPTCNDILHSKDVAPLKERFEQALYSSSLPPKTAAEAKRSPPHSVPAHEPKMVEWYRQDSHSLSSPTLHPAKSPDLSPSSSSPGGPVLLALPAPATTPPQQHERHHHHRHHHHGTKHRQHKRGRDEAHNDDVDGDPEHEHRAIVGPPSADSSGSSSGSGNNSSWLYRVARYVCHGQVPMPVVVALVACSIALTAKTV
eukprot:PhM_4_TR97/c0_g1_i1/m.22986